MLDIPFSMMIIVVLVIPGLKLAGLSDSVNMAKKVLLSSSTSPLSDKLMLMIKL